MAAFLALNSPKSNNYIPLHVFLQENIFKPGVNFFPQIFLPPQSHSQYFSACVVIKIGLSFMLRNPNVQVITAVGHRELSD